MAGMPSALLALVLEATLRTPRSEKTFSGRHITIGGDLIVEMSEEDAFYLISVGWTILGDV
jgi:hypothetical protein